MTVTAEDLAAHLRLVPVPPDQAEALQRVTDAAYGVIGPHLLDAVTPLPPYAQAALDTAVLRAGAELWRWQQATAGASLYADGQDYPEPVFRDVYHTVQPLLLHAGLVARGMA